MLLLRLPSRKTIRNLHALGLAVDDADVNVLRNRGSGPALVLAANRGTPGVVKALLARGANVNARDKQGRTALHHAAAVDSPATNRIVRILIAAGADVNAKDYDGVTPLMVVKGSRNIRSLVSRRPRMSIREEVETALNPLIGEPMSDMRRAVGRQMFEIGEQRPCKNHKGQDITRADTTLVVSCNWYITLNSDKIVSSYDFGPYPERRDEKAIPFYKMLGGPDFIISSVRADNNGGVKIRMAGGYTLRIETEKKAECGDPDEDTEQWRLLPKDETRRHFVVGTDGIERY